MKEKTQIIIFTLCIVVTLSLSISIYLRGNNNSCDKCSIDFITTDQFGFELDTPIITKVLAIDLWDGYLQDECILKWNRNQGYYED